MGSSSANFVIVYITGIVTKDCFKSNTFRHVLKVVALLNLLKGTIWFLILKIIHFATGQ